MSITSLAFLLYLAVVFVAYYAVPKRMQWIVLLAASYSFYLMAGVVPLIFVLCTTLLTYASGRKMGALRESAPSKKEAKRLAKPWLVATIIAMLAVLFLFKYYNGTAESINGILRTFAWSVEAPLINIMLPLGLSFYTFMSIGYCIDVYRGTIKCETNLAHYALFISFFPQAIQGPIGRYNKLEPQFMAEHHFDYDAFCRGAQLMIWGYFKKLVIADRLSFIVVTCFDDFANANYDWLQTSIAIFAYAIQIYADFSGGIDIVRGAAECMGIELDENFKRPYFGNSVGEYWRRWHMSLTNWMRDYVFYSLALSKLSNKIGKWGRAHFKGYIGKQMPTFLPTFTTFFLIGIWHGAGWGFIIYGFYNAIIIVGSQMLQPQYDKINAALHIKTESFAWKVFQIVRTFIIMAIGKTITRAVSVREALAMLVCSVSFSQGLSGGSVVASLEGLGVSYGDLAMSVIGCLVLFIASVIQERGVVIRDALAKKNIVLRWFVLIGGIMAIAVFGVYGIGYDVNAFIYNGF